MNKEMVHQTPKEKAAYWQEHVQRWQHSGLSKRQYCRHHELRYDKFVWWCRKVEKGYKDNGGFVSIHTPESKHTHAAIRITVGSIRIEVYTGADEHTLQAVLTAVKGVV